MKKTRGAWLTAGALLGSAVIAGTLGYRSRTARVPMEKVELEVPFSPASDAQLTGEMPPPLPEFVEPARAALEPFADEAALHAFVQRRIDRNAAEREHSRLVAAALEASGHGTARSLSYAAIEASLTNNQVAGVDEGDIVKASGDYLLVLRRGRIFSLRVGATVEPIDHIDAYPSADDREDGLGARPGWYDEMLVAGTTIVVLGYNPGVAASELGVFELAPDGSLSHRTTMFVGSGDYYSNRDYASRLIGDELVLYTPVSMIDGATVNRIRVADFQRGELPPLIQAANVYAPVQTNAEVLHTIVRCRVSDPALPCSARAVLAPAGHVFYVSSDAVYSYAFDGHGPEGDHGVVYRMPLAEGAPTAVRVVGVPIDSLSFHQRGDALHLVLEASEHRLTLARIPLASFASTPSVVPATAYTALPLEHVGQLHARFIDDRLVYGDDGAYAYDDAHGDTHAYVVGLDDPQPRAIDVGHAVSRVESLQTGALVVGNGPRGLQLTTLSFDGEPTVVDTLTRAAADEAEDRSHGFFFQPDGAVGGTFGVPVVSWNEDYTSQTAEISFVGVRGLEMRELGGLRASRAEHAEEPDDCVTSCVDWYGDTRPIFYRGRTFALLGYELVEAARHGGRVSAGRRVSFAPRPATETLGI